MKKKFTGSGVEMEKRRLFAIVLLCVLVLVLIGCEERIPIVPEPLSFSQEGGSYYRSIVVEITSEQASSIHYTTDGSIPTKESPVYHEPLIINTTTRLSAIALDEEGIVRQEKKEDYLIPLDTLHCPYLDVAAKTIYHVSPVYEYSRDDGDTWHSCDGASHHLESLEVGDKVWVRHQVVPSDLHYLGEIRGTTGYDLFAGQAFLARYNASDGSIDETEGVPYDPDLSDGSLTIAIPSLINRGDKSFKGTITLEFYASEDPVITEEDTMILSVSTSEFTLGSNEQYGAVAPGTWPTSATWFLGLLDLSTLVANDAVDLVGPYHIGYHITVSSSDGQEMMKANNWTLPQHTDSVYFTDPSDGDMIDGAFKVVNSWGEGGSWEHVADGAYYLSFEDALTLGLQIFYVFNNPDQPYRPTLLAKFELSHEDRSACPVSVGIGDPAHPIMEKRVQSLYFQKDVSTVVSGVSRPYPDHPMVLDVSEFAPYLDTHDLFLRVDNSLDGEHDATVSGFSLELHSDYSGADSLPIITIEASDTLPVTVEKSQSRVVVLETAGVLDPYQLSLAQPTARSVSTGFPQVEQRPLTDEEITNILSLQRKKEQNLSRSMASSRYGTGALPLSESDLRSVRTITSLGSLYRESLPSVVDLSASRYFPPIGNQGIKGSCAAFSNAYYIHTYNEAREHGWDLSGAEWIPSGSSGYPSLGYQDKIMSPDFSYHLVSMGPGSNHMSINSLLHRIGSATWSSMPYDNVDDMVPGAYAYDWPTEAAFREAALYRSRQPQASYFQENAAGMIILDSMQKVEVVRQLLAAGYCLSTSINAYCFFPNYADEDAWLNEHDVISLAGVTEGGIELFKGDLNHAQTIVGYKSGSAWNPDNP